MTIRDDATAPAPEQPIDQNIPPVDDNDSAPAARVDAPQVDAPKPEDEQERKGPTEPNSAGERLEQVAASRRKREEQATKDSAEAIVDPTAPEPVIAPAPAETGTDIKLKVRRREVVVTTAQRDALAAIAFAGEDATPEDIAHLPENKRNEFAEMEAARRSYRSEVRAAREEGRRPAGPDDPAPTVQPQATAPAPVAPTEPPKPTPAELFGKALEHVQLGGDPAEAQAMLAEGVREFVQQEIGQARDQQSEEQRTQTYVEEWKQGAASIEAEEPALVERMKTDPGARGALDANHVEVMKIGIARAIESAPPALQQEFVRRFNAAGMTLATLPPDNVKSLYKQMRTGPYELPSPAHTLLAAAKVTAQTFGVASTKAVPAEQTRPDAAAAPTVTIDRSGRKDSLVQPERAQPARTPSSRQPTPPTEAERHKQARTEIRENRRITRG